MRVEIHVTDWSVPYEYCVGGVQDANNDVVKDNVQARVGAGTPMNLGSGSYTYGFRVNRPAKLQLTAFQVEPVPGSDELKYTALGAPADIDAREHPDNQVFYFEVP